MESGEYDGKLFDALLRCSTEPVLLTLPEGRILRANPAACTLLGRSESELRTLGRQGLVVPTPALATLLSERDTHAHARGEVLFRRPDGSSFPTELSSTIVHGHDGEAMTLVVFRDVTEQRRLEAELRSSEVLFRAAFHTLPDGVTLTDQNTGCFEVVNAGATTVTGYEAHEMLGQSSNSLGLWSDDDRAAFVAHLQREGSVRDFPTHLRRKDGSVIDVVLSARPVVVGGRSLMLTVTRDVSLQVAAERARDDLAAQLLHSQKLEAVGQLAGGIAHDFNNLLTVILSCCELLRERLVEPSERDDLEEIRRAGERAADLTRQLLTFARRQSTRRQRVDLNELVEGSEKMLRRLLGEDLQLAVRAQPALPPISADRAQMEQVVMNLAVNARDAMSAGGHLTLETAAVVLDEAGAAPFPGAAPGAYVRLAVVDDGAGMPRAVQERAFEPFFTTKPVGKGTGLGLATVHGIVAQTDGFIRIESEEGRGTRIEMLFPIVPNATEERVRQPSTARDTGRETVLFVEDEGQVREVIARYLRAAGYRVLVASTGRAALEVASGTEHIDLVVSDVVMPEMSGPEMLGHLRTHRPQLRALFISGYPREALHHVGSDTELLWKPFTPSALLTRLRAALDAPRASV